MDEVLPIIQAKGYHYKLSQMSKSERIFQAQTLLKWFTYQKTFDGRKVRGMLGATGVRRNPAAPRGLKGSAPRWRVGNN